MNNSIWIVSSPSEQAEKMSSELGIPREIAQVLVNRKILDSESARRFLFGQMDDLYDPLLMRGMEKAVERIEKAISQREKILIFGDYDVDGVLSVVMLFKALESLGAEVDYYIPERLKEGYGLKKEYIEKVTRAGARLVISVDCGIKATQFVHEANVHGIDVIITDHHQPGSRLPDALTILNPVLFDSGYPDKTLAGVGVVFKLIHALLEKNGKVPVIPHYLKLVSIGTIADVAELRGENRLFVKLGLRGLEMVSNKGLKSLMETCNLSRKKISVADVGFRIGPRINAAGRMGMADLAVKLFFSDSHSESRTIVQRLEELNTLRQKTEEKILNQALDWIRSRDLDRKYKVFIMGCEEWHRGVTGIVASRIKDLFHRPVILFTYEDGKAYGSGRSIPEFSLIDCLNDCREYFLSFGGHNQAAGCVLNRGDIELLKHAVNSIAESRISEDDLRRKIYVDTKLEFSCINHSFLEHFFLLSPFGIGNPKPIFLTEETEVVSDPQKLKGKHIKLVLKHSGKIIDAISWDNVSLAHRVRKGDSVNIVYSLDFSSFRGEDRLYLNLEDLKA